jgi:hypothetical protein
MATFEFNKGQVKELKLKTPQAKIFASLEIKTGSKSLKVAGFTVINIDGNISIEDVQFDDTEIGIGNNIVGQKIKIVNDVTKFKVEKKELKEDDFVAECRLAFSDKNGTLGILKISDSDNPESNSVFSFLVKFVK